MPAVALEEPKSTMMGHPGMLDEIQAVVAERQRANQFNSPVPVPQAPQIPQAPQMPPVAPRQIPANLLPQQGHAQIPATMVPQGTPPLQMQAPQQHPVMQQAIPGQLPGQIPGQSQSSPLAANFGMQDARFGDDARHAVPAVRPYRDSLTEKVTALPAPVAASDDEWDESLITILLVFGVLLVACFVAPWSIGSAKIPTMFAWTIFSAEGVPIIAKIFPALIVATGLAAIAVGSLRIQPGSRALIATCIGLAPIAFLLATSKPFEWRTALSNVGTILIIGGLFARCRHDESILPRIIVSLAAAMLLALYFIPIAGTIPAKGLLDALSASPGATKLLPIIGISAGALTLGILPLTVTLLAFLVWMPGCNRHLLAAIAILLLFIPLVSSLCTPLLGDNVVANLKSGLSSYLFVPLAKTAWIAMACYGVRGLLDHNLNR
ncbi:MAG: hypothetical protein JKY56_19735 [Kofleriaceae bacterium]|nr:hypothetical protein [Kofleriaceae bacterium]